MPSGAYHANCRNTRPAAEVSARRRGLSAGVVRPGTDISDVLLAFHMSATAIVDHSARGLPSGPDRIRRMLHRALFVDVTGESSVD